MIDKNFQIFKKIFLDSYEDAKDSAMLIKEIKEKAEQDPSYIKPKLKIVIKSLIKFFAAGERLFKYCNEPGWKQFEEKKRKSAKILVVVNYIDEDKLDKYTILVIWNKLHRYITEILLPLNFENMFKGVVQKGFSYN